MTNKDKQLMKDKNALITRLMRRLDGAKYAIDELQKWSWKLHADELDDCDRILFAEEGRDFTEEGWCVAGEEKVFKWTDQDLIEEDIENGINCKCMEIVEETTHWETDHR